MKKQILLIITGLLVVGTQAHAVEWNDWHPAIISTRQGTTLSPSIGNNASSTFTTSGLRNDILQVQGEAILALETGIMSKELQSVVGRIRIETQNPEVQNASDLEIIEWIAEGSN